MMEHDKVVRSACESSLSASPHFRWPFRPCLKGSISLGCAHTDPPARFCVKSDEGSERTLHARSAASVSTLSSEPGYFAVGSLAVNRSSENPGAA